jgi:arylsulfatase A-like enzyme
LCALRFIETFDDTTVLDTLEETDLTNDTIIMRFADHGEGGLLHGMREKAYTAYEESRESLSIQKIPSS